MDRNLALSVLQAVLVLLCAGHAVAEDSTGIPIDGNSFKCLNQMTKVKHFYVDNLLGDLDATVAVARSETGGVYPPGSVLQLFPGEVMVKQKAGFNAATKDWEFFELEVNESGSKIRTRGFADVNNRFGKNCFACHVPARTPWDFICESGHGCEAIPIDRAMTGNSCRIVMSVARMHIFVIARTF